MQPEVTEHALKPGDRCPTCGRPAVGILTYEQQMARVIQPQPDPLQLANPPDAEEVAAGEAVVELEAAYAAASDEWMRLEAALEPRKPGDVEPDKVRAARAQLEDRLLRARVRHSQLAKARENRVLALDYEANLPVAARLERAQMMLDHSNPQLRARAEAEIPELQRQLDAETVSGAKGLSGAFSRLKRSVAGVRR